MRRKYQWGVYGLLAVELLSQNLTEDNSSLLLSLFKLKNSKELVGLVKDTNVTDIWNNAQRSATENTDEQFYEAEEEGDAVVYSETVHETTEPIAHEAEVKSFSAQLLHPSYRDFEAPVIAFATKKYLIRIDRMPGDRYRYLSWKVGKSTRATPDLILYTTDTKEKAEYFQLKFVNATYQYECIMYKDELMDTNEVTLAVYRNGKQLYHEEGHLGTF